MKVKKHSILVGILLIASTGIQVSCSSDDENRDYCSTADNICGTFTDNRDGQKYKWTKIGQQVWMAENLNYDVPDSDTDVCYDNSSPNCAAYGRLYNWGMAMAVCLVGWHLPSRDEWKQLVDFSGGSNRAGLKLKAAFSWDGEGNGTDDYSFSALAGGRGNELNRFSDVGTEGAWWSSSNGTPSETNGIAFEMFYHSSIVFGPADRGKSLLHSVRCLQD